jgi:hypothetical protein
MKRIKATAFWKLIGSGARNRIWASGICLVCLAIAACDDSTTESSTPVTAQSPGTQPSGNTEYGYNTKISFAEGGNAARYLVSGWSHAEAEGTWTDGNSARLAFTVPPSTQDVVFKATMSGFTKAPELPSQSVDVFINGQQTTHWEIAVKGLVQLLIPANALRDGRLELEFKLPKATSPSALGISADQRKLGLRFYDLELAAPPSR